jgi:excisionase family DNA binding protein
MIDFPENRTPDTGQSLDGSTVHSAQAAAMLGVNERTIRRAIARGDLRASKRSGTYIITRADLDRFQKNRTHPSPRAVRTIPDVRLDIRTVPGFPAAHTQIVGREQEQAAIRRLLTHERVRLLTLTGPGGVGKTRLALHVAATMRDAYADGAWLVDLAPLSQATLVPNAIARALGMRDTADGLETTLSQRHILLVLDNFEHVLAAAPGIAVLVSACPGVQVLVTSRSPLHLYEERLFPVPPLPTVAPEPATPVTTLAALPSVQLFVARAQAVKPAFALTDANGPAIATICHRVDGLPLAIELAAARGAVLSPQALLARLDRRLPLLTGGASDVPPRLQTMRDTIAWSHTLLDDVGQLLLRQASVFAGGFTEDAAAAVCDSRIDIFEGLSALVSQSLLRQTAPDDAEPRFGMLETVREYAGEQLALHGEESETGRRHAAWALALAERITGTLDGRDDRPKLDQLEAERENCRTALAWLLETGDVESALRLCSALLELWYYRGPVTEGRSSLQRSLTAPGKEPASPIVRIHALQAASLLAYMQRDAGETERLALESLAMARAVGTTFSEAWAYNLRGLAAMARGQPGEAAAHLDLALDLLPGDKRSGALAMVLMNRASVTADPGRARAYLLDALEICRESGNRGGDFVLILNQLGHVAFQQARYAEAHQFFIESLDRCREVRDFWTLPQALDGMAKVRSAIGQHGEATFLGGVADAVRAYMDVSASSRRVDGQLWGRHARLRIDPAADRVGAMEDMIATARALPIALPAGDPPSPGASHGLTPRERDVLAFLVDGRTNRAIAAALSLSERTVESHVLHVLTKLGLESRSAAAVWAVRNGLA